MVVAAPQLAFGCRRVAGEQLDVGRAKVSVEASTCSPRSSNIARARVYSSRARSKSHCIACSWASTQSIAASAACRRATRSAISSQRAIASSTGVGP